MKRSVVALSLLVLALTGCASDTEQSGGSSNPDSQVEQPPLPGEEGDEGGADQGTDVEREDGTSSSPSAG